MKTLAITMMMALSICFAFHSEAGVNGSSDDDVIEIFITENINEFNPIRFPTLVPIVAYYYVSLSYVDVEFLNNMGEVTITLNNLTTGGTSTMQINSTFGEAVIPVGLGCGNYRIDFSSTCGNYYGNFIVIN